MLFATPLTVPAGTPKDAPVEIDLDICAGVITRISVEFNNGTNFMVHAYVCQALHQLWPLNPEGTVRSDGWAISSQESYPVPEPPFVLTCGAYSPDTDYDHEVYFYIEITPEAEAQQNQAFLSWGEKIMQLLGIG